ncbi:hypothetical protein DDZ14_16085 [Maritimibacter sp. 55A14]|uniref:DUF6950 family protein n=1 Tax=Maritimibacter sp. 55A14 TaxID=2174844 RepID=UPI000D61C9EA|nr:hypothetical protein [Maritimibacter sp. 55A14]PWE29960.1 hypothetical protein DDZ14_16085 [Maritimibacter sp. 55A14]
MKLPDWRPRLLAYVTAAAREPFVPGTHDCALFAAGAAEAQTGRDPAEGLRGTYSTLTEGLRRLGALGHADHVEMAAAHFAEVPASFAQVGDLAVVATDEGDALGVVQGEAVYVLQKSGIAMVPLTAAHRAFRVA